MLQIGEKNAIQEALMKMKLEEKKGEYFEWLKGGLRRRRKEADVVQSEVLLLFSQQNRVRDARKRMSKASKPIAEGDIGNGCVLSILGYSVKKDALHCVLTYHSSRDGLKKELNILQKQLRCSVREAEVIPFYAVRTSRRKEKIAVAHNTAERQTQASKNEQDPEEMDTPAQRRSPSPSVISVGAVEETSPRGVTPASGGWGNFHGEDDEGFSVV